MITLKKFFEKVIFHICRLVSVLIRYFLGKNNFFSAIMSKKRLLPVQNRKYLDELDKLFYQ